MRLRHRHRPHSGPARHLNPPFGAKRRHGGRLHVKAEGRETRPRSDRPRSRQMGGAAASGLTPAQLAALASAGAQQPSGIGSANMNQALTEQALAGQKRGGAVAKRRAHGGRARHHASPGPPAFGGSKAIPPPQAAPPQALPQASDDEEADGLKSGGGKWIQKAIKRPGALHRALHVPQGEKIPAKKLAKASHSENPRLRKMVGLAKTLKAMH